MNKIKEDLSKIINFFNTNLKNRGVFMVFIILISLFTFLFSWEICFPDGCFYDSQKQSCSDNSCINESILSHIQEKNSFLTIISTKTILLFSLVFLGLFLSHLFFYDKKLLLKILCEFKAFLKKLFTIRNWLILLFSKGILNTKIF